MQAEHFCKGEKGAAKVSRELVKFAGERLPEYRWLEGVCPPEEPTVIGGGRPGNPD